MKKFAMAALIAVAFMASACSKADDGAKVPSDGSQITNSQ